MATSGAQPGNQNAATGKRWRDAINRALSARAKSDGIKALDDLAEKLLTLCDQGELGALRELGDRIDGRAPQSVALTGEDGGPVQYQQIERKIVRPTD